MSNTFTQAARAVLLTADAHDKAAAARQLADDWQAGNLADNGDWQMPDRPGRPPAPELLPPRLMPRRRKAGALHTRIALIHAVAHIELNAIDLAVDIAGRFGPSVGDAVFISDWLSVAADEARHFGLLNDRLRVLGSHYGALPAHDGLWEAAEATAHDVLARLAVAHMVLEARGLDVTPAMIQRFQRAGDQETADVLGIIYRDEIGHVRLGAKWFRRLGPQDSTASDNLWRDLVAAHFKGRLKPPFNSDARDQAEMPEHLYLPLAVSDETDR